MHKNMELQEHNQPLRRQDQQPPARAPSPSAVSTRRKQIKFYMEVAVLLMVAIMLFGAVLKALFSGGDFGLQNEQIAGVLRLVNNIGQGLPVVGAVTECQNGTMC